MQDIDSSTWSLVKRLVENYLSAYFGRLLIAVFFMILASAMLAALALLMEPVFDKIFTQTRQDLILPLSFAVFGCFLVSGIASYFQTLLMNIIGVSIVADIQKQLFSSFLNLDLKFFHANPSGQLVSRVINDVTVMRNAVVDSLTGIGKSLITLILLIGVMFYQDWRLACIVFFAFPFAAVFVIWIGKKLRKISKNMQGQTAFLNGMLIQIFQGIRQVQAHGMEAFEKDRAGNAIEKVRKLAIKAIKYGSLSTPFNELLVGLAVGGVIIYGGNRVLLGQLTVGELTSFIAAFSLAYQPMKKLAKLNNTLQTGLGASVRVFEMLDRQSEILEDKENAITLKASKPAIEFDNVTFSYGEDDGHALKDVSMRFSPGKVTALVGPSGSGKTTALNMIPRFYDAVSGEVLIDGVNVKKLTLKSLREHIALVSQDITIFDDTVKANIAYGRPDISEDEVINAAKAANAHQFIKEMPEGYETRLGEHGAKLSGGQRQRIAIARAILMDAPILLLDEATSALDNESEKAVQDALKGLQVGRTTVVIAHRLSTIKNADQIIALDKGKISEVGDHNQLLSNDGLYARLYSAK